MVWFNPGQQLSTRKKWLIERKCNGREIIHCTSVRDSFLSHACPHTMFPFPGNTKEQSPHSTPVPWNLLRAVPWKLSVSWCETAASPPEDSQTCTCLPATQLQAALLLAGVGEPGFPGKQEEKVTHETMESNGSWNCCPNRASILLCPIPQGTTELRVCFPSILTHQLFTRHCGSSLLCQILALKSWWANLLSGWTGRVMTAFRYLLGGPNVCAYQNQLEELTAITWIQELDAAG